MCSTQESWRARTPRSHAAAVLSLTTSASESNPSCERPARDTEAHVAVAEPSHGNDLLTGAAAGVRYRDTCRMTAPVHERARFVSVEAVLLRPSGRHHAQHRIVTLVLRVRDTITVNVVVTGVPDIVAIEICLIGIRQQRAVVIGIVDPVVVVIVVAGIPDQVPVRVLLQRIVVRRAVVIGIDDAVPVAVA